MQSAAFVVVREMAKTPVFAVKMGTDDLKQIAEFPADVSVVVDDQIVKIAIPKMFLDCTIFHARSRKRIIGDRINDVSLVTRYAFVGI